MRFLTVTWRIKLELRERLLEQSVQFYKSAKIFSEKMNQATTAFERLTENKVSNTERGYDLIWKYDLRSIFRNSKIEFKNYI